MALTKWQDAGSIPVVRFIKKLFGIIPTGIVAQLRDDAGLLATLIRYIVLRSGFYSVYRSYSNEV